MKKAVFLISALLVAPAWAINKCTGADGKVSFQETACPAGSKADASGPAPREIAPQPQNVMSARDVARAFDAQLESKDVQKKINQKMQVRQVNERAMARGLSGEAESCGGDVFHPAPSVGMTENAFLQCTQFAKDWDHLKVNETETHGGVHRQYVYPTHAPIRYVYTERGRITAISR